MQNHGSNRYQQSFLAIMVLYFIWIIVGCSTNTLQVYATPLTKASSLETTLKAKCEACERLVITPQSNVYKKQLLENSIKFNDK